VVIARINNDISIADFEANVRNLLKDVEDLYWDLSLAYRAYDAEVVAKNSNLSVWRRTKVKFDLQGASDTSALAQSEEAYYDSRSRSEAALARIYSTEAELRRLIGMPVNDGYILRPVDEPATGEFLPDWHISLAEALTQRQELRRQKWIIKSLELQLKAARTLTRPRLDFVSAYQVNMFGDTLLSQRDNDERDTPQGLNSAYETLTQGDQTGWNLGFEMSMPLGFRTAHAQVRNLELQLTKARTVLGAQELEVSHELGRAFQELDRAYQTAQTNFNRRRAAELRVKAEQNKVELGLGDQQGQNNVDLLLRAQISLAQAEVGYYQSLTEYNKAITDFYYRKGSLLEFNNVSLAESGWDPQAYILALRRAWSRSHALENEHLLDTEPGEFVTGPEEAHLSMPYEEVQPLMNLNQMEPGDANPTLSPGMIDAPEPGVQGTIQELMPPTGPTSPRPYEEPMPDPTPMAPDIEDELGWRKRDIEEEVPVDLTEATKAGAQRPRRAELPIR
jgi:outer membrane protein TolC